MAAVSLVKHASLWRMRWALINTCIAVLTLSLVVPTVCARVCPVWLDEYATFHSTQRGKPGTKYLLHEVAGLAGGLGDRLRGMLFSVRVAQALRRVVLFSWQHPYPVDKFFIPSGRIDWTLSGITYQQEKLVRFIDSPNEEVTSGSLANEAAIFITLQTNMVMDGPCYGCPPLDPASKEAACLWRTLFTPQNDIVDSARQELVALYGAVNVAFVAIHLRLGYLTGEMAWQSRGNGPLHDFLDVIRCANGMASRHNITLPFLVATDNHNLRKFLQDKNIPNMVAAQSLPVHLDHAPNESLDRHKRTIVDLVLLGWAECLIRSRSGFSHHAWLFGGAKTCHADFLDCSNSSG